MKKLIYVMCVVAATFILSCGHETEKMKNAKDSVENVNQQQQAMLDDLMETLVDVSTSLDSIAVGQGMLTTGSESQGLTRQQIKERLDNFKQMLNANREKLDKMQALLADRDDKIGKLNALITHLSNELDEREATINKLTSIINDQKTTIQDLQEHVERNEVLMGEMEEENVQQREQLSRQDVELNTVYYVMGTTKELKSHGLLKGGFLKKNKVDVANIDKSKLNKADKRMLADIAIPGKSARVMSGQPEDAYQIIEKDKNSCLLKITNKERFWNVSNVLIIEIK